MASTCSACGKVIVAQYATTASGKTYHKEHFNCARCCKPLSSEKYFEQPSEIVCQACHKQYYSHKCVFCREAIEDEGVSALGNRYHTHHFRCSSCDAQLTPEKFFSANGRLYCQQHAPGTAPEVNCAVCQQGITGTAKKALGNNYHANCFTCAGPCGKLLTGQFFEIRSKAYCNVCAMKAI